MKASSLMGFEISPVLLFGQTTRRLAKSTHSHFMLMISDMRAAKGEQQTDSEGKERALQSLRVGALEV